MFNQLTVTILGGDRRQQILKTILAPHFKEALSFITDQDFCRFSLPSLKNSDIVIFPLPSTRDNETLFCPLANISISLEDVLKFLKPGTLVLGAKLPEKITKKYLGTLFFSDYSEDEHFKVLNAIPTVEGALEIAIKETDFTLFGSKCLVIGYGNIGIPLTSSLISLGASVTATARRKKDLARILNSKAHAVNTCDIKQLKEKFDIIFNTVPSNILGEGELTSLKSKPLIIDLASSPCVDISLAEKHDIRVIHALSLPGKTAPLSAAKNAADTILKIIKEETK